MTFDPWPEAVSDGLLVPCAFCGRVPVVDYRVDDDTWRRVVPEHARLGVVCLDCLVALDVTVVHAVEQVQVATSEATAVLDRTAVYDWARDSVRLE